MIDFRVGYIGGIAINGGRHFLLAETDLKQRLVSTFLSPFLLVCGLKSLSSPLSKFYMDILEVQTCVYTATSVPIVGVASK